MTRRFPPPWTVENIAGGFVVKDASGQQLAHVYADNPQIVNTLTEDEARRIASYIARLPEYVRKANAAQTAQTAQNTAPSHAPSITLGGSSPAHTVQQTGKRVKVMKLTGFAIAMWGVSAYVVLWALGAGIWKYVALAGAALGALLWGFSEFLRRWERK